MSLEIALAENTAALRELIAHLKSGVALKQPTLEEIDANIKELNKAPKAQAAKSTSAATAASAAPTPPTAEAGEGDAQGKTDADSAQSAASAETEQQASTAATEPAPDYATTAKAVTDLVKAKGREVGVSVLAKFGAANLKEVKPEQFAEVIAACKEAAK